MLVFIYEDILVPLSECKHGQNVVCLWVSGCWPIYGAQIVYIYHWL